MQNKLWAKPKKDRIPILANKMTTQLKTLLKNDRPKCWLMEGVEAGDYAARSDQATNRKAVKEAEVNPLATVPTLKDSFASHLMDKRKALRSRREHTQPGCVNK